MKLYGTATLPTLTSIENLYINGEGTVNASTSGVTSVEIDSFTVADTVTLAAGQALTVNRATGAAADLAIAAAATVTAHTITVIASGDATNAVDLQIAGTGVTTLTLNTTGTTASFVDIDFTGTVAKTVTINAASDLTIENIEVATDINAAASTGKVALNTLVAKAVVTGGSGNDTITLDQPDNATHELTINLGAGDDKVSITNMDAADRFVDSKFTLAGGTGIDTFSGEEALIVELGALTASNFAKKGISGFEKIEADDALADGGVHNLKNFGANYFITTVDSVNDAVISGVTSGVTYETGKSVDVVGGTADYHDIRLDDKEGEGDVVNVIVNNTAGAGALQIRADEVEIMNITSSASTQANVIHLKTANLTTLNVTTGAGDVTLDMSDATGQANEGLLISLVDASGSKGAGGIVFTADANNLVGITFKGGSGGDTFIGGALSDQAIGGSGADLFDMLAGTSNTINLSAGGNDEVEYSVLTGKNTITGFSSGDIIDMKNAVHDDGENVVTIQVATAVDPTTATTQISLINATTTSILATGTEKIASFTDMTDVAAYLEEGFSVANTETFAIILNDGTNSYIYDIADTGATTIQAAHVTLIGVVNNYILGAADVIQTN